METVTVESAIQIRYEAFEGSSFYHHQTLINTLLPWWSRMTIEDELLLDKTVQELQKNCLFAIFGFHNNKVVAASGVFSFNNLPHENFTCDNLLWRGQKVVELGSCYVDKDYRKQHIATSFVEIRLEFVKKHEFFAFCVTRNKVMHKINTLIATHIEDLGSSFMPFRRLVRRDCHCNNLEKPSCAVCPGDEYVICVYNCCL